MFLYAAFYAALSRRCQKFEDNYPVVCAKCLRRFQTHEEYAYHSSCRQLKVLEYLPSFYIHIHGMYRCSLCSKYFNKKYHYLCHLKNDHIPRRCTCGELLTGHLLRIHRRMHEIKDVRPKCGICHAIFSSKKAARSHLLLHFRRVERWGWARGVITE